MILHIALVCLTSGRCERTNNVVTYVRTNDRGDWLMVVITLSVLHFVMLCYVYCWTHMQNNIFVEKGHAYYYVDVLRNNPACRCWSRGQTPKSRNHNRQNTYQVQPRGVYRQNRSSWQRLEHWKLPWNEAGVTNTFVPGTVSLPGLTLPALV